MALRHPLLLAQTMATVDLLSHGRLMVAAGVGGAFNQAQQQEWRNAGVAASQRARRLEEMVQVLKGLGTGHPLSFHGRHFQFDEVIMEPRPVRPGGVPILLACHGRAGREAQYARAARLADGVISISDTPAEYAEMLRRVRELAAGLGRDPARLETAMYVTVNVEPDLRRAEAEAGAYLTSYYGANIWGDRWGPFGGPSRVAARLAEYAAAGAQTIIVRFAAPDAHRQLDIFLEQVAPELAD
jgi:alkanesulfonate monooxygenase SsuD/methylene tetrahydromethanopterin reductase-like flavin-dependent oxidoreductase (luciferase family)